MIYEPHDDSYLLKKYVLKLVDKKVLDMGTGSGIQAQAALEKTADVLAVDINLEAIKLCKKKGLRAIQSDLFTNVKEKFDWIIFNPPYLPEDPTEPKDSRLATTGGKKGFEIIEKFLKQAKKHLVPTGKILILISSLTGDPKQLFKNYKYKKLGEKKLFMETLSVYQLS